MQKERILVFEGNAKNLVEIIRNEGYEVIAAEDSTKALEELRHKTFDLCILPYKQSSNDGIALAKAIRGLRPSVPIIFIGTDAGMDDVLSLMKTGPVDFLEDYSHPVLVSSTIKRNIIAHKFTSTNTKELGKPNIIVVDDDDTIREGLTTILNDGGLSCKATPSASDALKMAEKEAFHLLITDLNLHDMEGTELIKRFKYLLPDSMAIIITGCPSVESAVEAVKHSVADYIVKPLRPDDVIQRVETCWEKHRQGLLIKQLLQSLQTSNQELEKANKKLNELSITDGLTSLYNHRFLMETLPMEYTRSRRYGLTLSIILIDIDDFKEVNDQFGHSVGDKVLAETARIIKNTLRDVDIAGRYGGEEFCVLLPSTHPKGAMAVAQRICNRIASHNFKEGETSFHITVSIGISSVSDPDTASANALLEHADRSLYAAKRNGKNCVCSWESIAKEMTGLQKSAPLLYGEKTLKNLYNQAIRALVNALELKDGYTATHSHMVAYYAAALANKLGLDQDMVQVIKTAGLLHDVGKVGVPDDILKKKGPLLPEEFDLVKKHPALSIKILNDLGFLRKELEIVRYHQERYDGAGYPHAIGGETIPLGARILAICDTFEAMTANRPYRKALPVEVAVEELKRHAGTQFDPKLVDIFINSLPEILGNNRQVHLEGLNKTVNLPQLALQKT